MLSQATRIFTLFITGISLLCSSAYAGENDSSVIKVRPSWDKMHAIVGEICERINPDDYDVLFGISAGGLVPTALFSLELGNKNVMTISTESYTGMTRGKLRIKNGPEKGNHLEGKRVLLIDDIVDSGATIEAIKQLLIDTYKVESVTTAVIYVNGKTTATYPDFWGEESFNWIEFPWELTAKEKQLLPE